MIGMDSHFYDQTSPLNSSFENSNHKASSRVPKCVSPLLTHHVPHGPEGIPTDLNTPELTFDHMSIQQFIRNENNHQTNPNPNSNNNNNDSSSNSTSSNTNTSSSSSSSNTNNHHHHSVVEDHSIFQNLITDKNQVAHHRQTHHHHPNLNPVQSSTNRNGLHGGSGPNSHSSQYPTATTAAGTSATSSYHQQPQQHGQHHTPMPQQPSIGTNRYGLEAGSAVKQEPLDSDDFSTNTCSQNSVFVPSQFAYGNDTRVNNPNTNNSRSVEAGDNGANVVGRHMTPFSMAAAAGSSVVPSHSVRNSANRVKNSSKKQIDKGSDEYKKRRERNNIAVRKSREKAKIRSRETEKKVTELARENEQLKKKVDSLCKELNVLKSLLTTVGVPPESVDSEIEKGLQMESHMQSNFNQM